MKENFVFPAIMSEEEDQMVTISFPTLGDVATCVEKNDDVIGAAQELLALTLIDYIDSNQPLPEAIDTPAVIGQGKLVYVHVWLPYFRSKTREVYVKKTLTIPAWLDILAKQNDINFSSTLTDAIKHKLNLV